MTNGSYPFNFDATLELVKTSETVASGSLTTSNTQFNLAVRRLDAVGEPNTLSYSGDVVVKEVT